MPRPRPWPKTGPPTRPHPWVNGELGNKLAEAVRSRASDELQRSSRRFLHAWNLPAGSDIAQVRHEIGALNREVRALSRQVEDELRKHFGEKVYKTVIPRNVSLSEAPSFGKPILLYDANSAGAISYLNLAGEVIRRLA